MERINLVLPALRANGIAPVIALRDYQQWAIDDLRASIAAGHRAPLAVLPTGAGKTVVFSEIARLSRGRVLVVAHRSELIWQAVQKIRAAGIEPGIIMAGTEPDYSRPVQVASVQTLVRRLAEFTPDLIILDEAAHATAGTWRRVIEAYPEAYRIGFTATPCRLSGEGLGDVFDALIRGPSVADLTARGYLCPARYFAPAQIDREGLRVIAGDFDRHEIEQRARAITGDAVATYQRLAAGKQAIVFCASVTHSKAVRDAFRAAGIACEHLDGSCHSTLRARVMSDFSERRVQVLCNVEIFGEGLDIPGIEVAILLRPTASLSLHLQQIGRALRTAPGKTEALILDHAGNCIEHGMADEPREWSLDGAKRKPKDAVQAASRCPACFAMWPGAGRDCPQCGEVRPLTPREIKQQTGELVELQRRTATVERKRAQSYEELVAIGKRRGYKSPSFWARKILSGRHSR